MELTNLTYHKKLLKKHGQEGTAPATLVRLVLEQKDREIRNLKAGLVCVS